MEIWIPYGSSEVGVGVKPENLSAIVKPHAQETVQDIKKEIENTLDNTIANMKLDTQNREKSKLAVIIDSSLGEPFFDTINLLVVELCGRLEINNVVISWRNKEGYEKLHQTLQSSNISNIKKLDENISSSNHLSHKNLEDDNETNITNIQASFRLFINRVGVDPIWNYKGSISKFPGLLDFETRTELLRTIVTSYLSATTFDIKILEKSINKLASSIGPCLSFDIFVNEEEQIAKISTHSFGDTLIKLADAIDEIYKIKAETTSDILVVSAGGSQYDNTLENSLDAIMLNKDLVKKGGTIILVAECLDGYGNEEFLEITSKHSEIKNIKSLLKKEPTIEKLKAYTLKELLTEYRLCLVSVLPDYYARSIFKFKTYRTVSDALESALRIIGKQATITVVPYGAYTQGIIKEKQ